jgi:shikimate dehydrogenase
MLAYDLLYSSAPTPFMQLASRGGARKISDGLGMLIEQAGESFHLWRGVRPDTASVFKELRRLLSAEAVAESAAVR